MLLECMTTRSLKKELRKNQFRPVRQKGSHERWKRTNKNGESKSTTIHATKKVTPEGTLVRIRQQTGLKDLGKNSKNGK
jgi:predicted RNA binding protein YcfA (HicA-like mRNA interferase family)